jgi:hypothetical protein
MVGRADCGAEVAFGNDRTRCDVQVDVGRSKELDAGRHYVQSGQCIGGSISTGHDSCMVGMHAEAAKRALEVVN